MPTLFYRARYYDPVLKRFISEDPIGLRAGTNFYAYVDDNPLSNVDSLGLGGGPPPRPSPSRPGPRRGGEDSFDQISRDNEILRDSWERRETERIRQEESFRDLMRKFDELRENDPLTPQREPVKEQERIYDPINHRIDEYIKEKLKEKEKEKPYCS